MGALGFKMLGVECPECGDLRTGVMKAGLDSEGHRIRGRYCKNCDHTFTTLEIPIPFVFNRMDTIRPDSALQRLKGVSARHALPRREPDRFAVTQVEGEHRLGRRPVDQINIRLIHGKKTDLCRRGLHLMVGHNALMRSDGSRTCRECTNINVRERRLEFRRRFPVIAREQDAVKRTRRRELRERRRAEAAAAQRGAVA